MTFNGSTLNVSPLCQNCELRYFADKNDIMFHQCDICKQAYEEYQKQLEWDYMAHTDIRD